MIARARISDRVAHADFGARRHLSIETRTDALTPRAAWLAKLASDGAFDKIGRLRRDVRDPFTGETHTVSHDRERWRDGLFANTARRRRRKA